MRSRLATTFVLLAVGCKHDSPLDRWVTAHCDDVAIDLAQTTKSYSERSKLADESLTPEQRQTADDTDGIIPAGTRYVVVARMNRDLLFCQQVRDIDDKQMAALNQRTSTAMRAYGASKTVDDATKALADLGAIANEISHLPLKH